MRFGTGLVLLLLTGACGGATNGAPLVSYTQDLPDDVIAEIATVSAGVDTVFGPLDCGEPPELQLVPEVGGGDARYVIGERRIEIEIPTSPQRFRESLVHELAHHIEHNCPGFDSLRQQLLGLTPGDDWEARDLGWEERPVELYAEAVVVAVLGDRIRSDADMPIPAGFAGGITSWAASGNR